MLTASGRQTLAATVVRGREMFALDDLAPLFQLTVHEDTLGAITVSYKNRTIVLTPNQTLVSVNGRLLSLSAPLAREGRRWLVPVDFVSRALAPVYDARIELRTDSRLLIIGNLRVPRVAVREEPAAGGVRLTIDVRPRTPEAIKQEGEQLLITFEADALDPSWAALPPTGLLQGLTVIEPATLALDLGPQFASFHTSTQAIGATAGRITLDLLAKGATGTPPAPAPAPPVPTPFPRVTPPAPAVPSVPSAPASPLPFPAVAPSVRTIVIDPGHGGTDTGVKGPHGTLEKNITLAVARQLKAMIESRLGLRVLLTRNGDQTLSADDRAALANNNKADLFLSLHANASFRSSVQGAEIFYLGLDQEAAQAAQAAEAGAAKMPVFGGGTRVLEILPWQVAQARFVQESATFASMIERQFQGHVPLDGRGPTQAPLRVLVGANMPAVLVEMGYLSNPTQEDQLGTAAFQQTIVQALYAAIVQFRNYVAQQSGAPAAAAAAPKPKPGGGQGR